MEEHQQSPILTTGKNGKPVTVNTLTTDIPANFFTRGVTKGEKNLGSAIGLGILPARNPGVIIIGHLLINSIRDGQVTCKPEVNKKIKIPGTGLGVHDHMQRVFSEVAELVPNFYEYTIFAELRAQITAFDKNGKPIVRTTPLSLLPDNFFGNDSMAASIKTIFEKFQYLKFEDLSRFVGEHRFPGNKLIELPTRRSIEKILDGVRPSAEAATLLEAIESRFLTRGHRVE